MVLQKTATLFPPRPSVAVHRTKNVEERSVPVLLAGQVTTDYERCALAAGLEVVGRADNQNELLWRIKMHEPAFAVLFGNLEGPRDLLQLARMLMCEMNLPCVVVLDALDMHQVPRIRALGPLGCLVQPVHSENLVATLASGAGRLGASDGNLWCASWTRACEPIAGGLDPSRIERTHRFIERNLNKSISVTDMARELGLSTSHFAQQYRKATGKTPFQALREHRITEAKALLSLTDRSIADIAQDVGYAAQSQFTTAFLQVTGTTPARFRSRC